MSHLISLAFLSLTHIIKQSSRSFHIMSFEFDIPKSIDIKYDTATVQNMMSLLKAAPFPDKAPIDADSPWKLGIEYDYLKELKTIFQTEWSWEKLEKKISKYNNFLVHYECEGDVMDLHFVHAKSSRGDAIPLILLHGWPGSSPEHLSPYT